MRDYDALVWTRVWSHWILLRGLDPRPARVPHCVCRRGLREGRWLHEPDVQGGLRSDAASITCL